MITVNRQLAGALDEWRRGLPFLLVGRGALSLAIRLASPGEPLRAPHHTTSERGVASELDRAAGGVLLLDEAPEFPQRVLELVHRSVLSGPGCRERDIRLVLTVPPELFAWRRARNCIRSFAPFAGIVRMR